MHQIPNQSQIHFDRCRKFSSLVTQKHFTPLSILAYFLFKKQFTITIFMNLFTTKPHQFNKEEKEKHNSHKHTSKSNIKRICLFHKQIFSLQHISRLVLFSSVSFFYIKDLSFFFLFATEKRKSVRFFFRWKNLMKNFSRIGEEENFLSLDVFFLFILIWILFWSVKNH